MGLVTTARATLEINAQVSQVSKMEKAEMDVRHHSLIQMGMAYRIRMTIVIRPLLVQSSMRKAVKSILMVTE